MSQLGRRGKTYAVILALVEYVSQGGSLDNIAVFLSSDTKAYIKYSAAKNGTVKDILFCGQ